VCGAAVPSMCSRWEAIPDRWGPAQGGDKQVGPTAIEIQDLTKPQFQSIAPIK
jgi:hypothetical protein